VISWSPSGAPVLNCRQQSFGHPNGFGAHSPGGYGLLSALVIEVLILTFVFLLVILAPPTNRSSAPSAGCRLVSFSLT